MTGILEKGRTRHTETAITRAREMSSQGISVSQIARTLDVNYTVARRWVDEEYRLAHNAQVKQARMRPRNQD